jgi:hypothetical protein
MSPIFLRPHTTRVVFSLVQETSVYTLIVSYTHE